VAQVVVILNPLAGGGRGKRRKDQLARAMQQAGLCFDIVETRETGDGIQLAADAHRGGAQIVVAAGGDGTVNEVINGLALAANRPVVPCAPRGAPISDLPPIDPPAVDPQPADPARGVGTLALCPIGTANDLADMLDLPRKVDLLVQRIVQGRTRRIDLGCCLLKSPDRQLLRYFGNNMGLGFEAQVTLESYKIKWMQGAPRYLVAVLAAIRHFHSPQVELEWRRPDDTWERRSQPMLLVSLGNSERTGGMFYVTPGASVDDGLLRMATARKVSTAGILRLLPQVLRGTHGNDPAVEIDDCRELRYSCAAGVPVHLDGEVVMEDVVSAHVVVQPRCLEIIV